MAQLTDERRGQIALTLIKHLLREKGIRELRANEIKREIGNVSKATNIPKSELSSFVKELATELLTEAFPDEE